MPRNLENLFQFGLLDGARISQAISKGRNLSGESISLYRHEEGEKHRDIQPFHLRVEPQSEFLQWHWENGGGKIWGILVNQTQKDKWDCFIEQLEAVTRLI